MQSRWADRDAQAAVDRYAKAGIARDLALRVYTTRLLGGDPKLVLHGGGNTSVKTRLRDLLGDEAEVLCVKGSGWDMAAIEPAGLPAVRLDPLRKLRALDDICPTRTWCACSAPTSSIRRRPTRRSRRCCTPSCRTSSSTTRTRPRVLSLIDQPDGAKLLRARSTAAAWASCPTSCRASASRKKAAEVFDAEPEGRGPDPRQARHLHLRRRRARSLRAHDRDGDARRSSGSKQDRKAVFVVGATAATQSRRSPRSRRSCAARVSRPMPTIEGAWQRLVLEFPHRRRDPRISSTARTSRAMRRPA